MAKRKKKRKDELIGSILVGCVGILIIIGIFCFANLMTDKTIEGDTPKCISECGSLGSDFHHYDGKCWCSREGWFIQEVPIREDV